ncbi:Fc.00g001740.m01.CDS01 [Cosmosporella sp. VM-42]
MSPTQMALISAPYIPSSDAMDRHDYGVTKNRKSASTGGGRAWSEDEEVYLLQTRLQKMPYKHIAAHLKKTELACRLHYHQLSHGSNRRKRAASCSSGSSNDQSPIQQVATPSPARESVSRSVSPLGSSISYGTPGNGIQLPSILTAGASSGLPAILPKPMSMTLPPPSGHTRGYSPPVTDNHISQPPVLFHHAPSHNPSTPPLRLDCSALPPPSMSTHTPAHVDLARLQAIYNAHRASFWAAIAHDYGSNVSPVALEQAWKTGACCNSHSTPITPVSSPDNGEREPYVKSQDKTRISSILGIDADPRTARDRDIVKRMEEERFGVMSAPA